MDKPPCDNCRIVQDEIKLDNPKYSSDSRSERRRRDLKEISEDINTEIPMETSEFTEGPESEESASNSKVLAFPNRYLHKGTFVKAEDLNGYEVRVFDNGHFTFNGQEYDEDCYPHYIKYVGDVVPDPSSCLRYFRAPAVNALDYAMCDLGLTFSVPENKCMRNATCIEYMPCVDYEESGRPRWYGANYLWWKRT